MKKETDNRSNQNPLENHRHWNQAPCSFSMGQQPGNECGGNMHPSEDTGRHPRENPQHLNQTEQPEQQARTAGKQYVFHIETGFLVTEHRSKPGICTHREP